MPDADGAEDDSDEDPELKAFADKAIRDKMRELNRASGAELDEDSDEDLGLSELDE
jgi:hypothetical protein